MPPPRPDKYSDRIGWNESWEHDLMSLYSRDTPLPPVINDLSPDRNNLNDLLVEGTRLSAVIWAKEVYEIQCDLASFAALKFATEDFEQRWAELLLKDRKNFVLEGIWRAGCIPDLEERRLWCPEITISNLAYNDGRGYLDLLTQLMPSDLDRQHTEPIMIPHPKVEELLGGSSSESAYITRLGRCYFMTLSVWQIILAFYGIVEPAIRTKPIRDRKHPTSSKALQKSYGRDNYRQHNAEQKAVAKTLPNKCWTCNKNETQLLGTGKKLSVCAKCRGIGRTIWYCSKDCQVKDWKNGVPVPHRTICGKDLSTSPQIVGGPRKSEPAAETDIRFPPAHPSFRRSPALLQQIKVLKALSGPNPDYMIMFPPPHSDQGARILGRREEFLVMRRRAFINGDARAVARMFDFLARQKPVADLAIKKQFEKEYRVNVDEARDAFLTPPTEEELDIARRIVDMDMAV